MTPIAAPQSKSKAVRIVCILEVILALAYLSTLGMSEILYGLKFGDSFLYVYLPIVLIILSLAAIFVQNKKWSIGFFVLSLIMLVPTLLLLIFLSSFHYSI